MRRGAAGRTTVVLAVVVVLLASLAGGGYLAYDNGLLDRFLDQERAAPAELPPPAAVSLPDAARPAPVLAAATGPAPNRVALRRRLSPLLKDGDLGPHRGVLVQDLSTGKELLRAGGRDLFTPASTLKILTSVAVLDQLGPDHRFSTSVVRGTAPNQLVLVGGGDPLLARTPPRRGVREYPKRATTYDLARRTAAALKADGVTQVTVTYDSSLFAGPAENPAWEAAYVPDGVVSRISALWVDEGVEKGGAGRSASPGRAAAETFAAQLDRRGITVRGRPMPRKAPQDAETVAAVESPPLDQVVAHTLLVSDNEGAEVLLRHVALAAERPGSFGEGVKAMVRTLTGLGVDLSRARLYDGSGLARRNRLPLDALVETLAVAADPDRAALRSAVTGLPVAGFSGSLDDRFDAELRPPTKAGLGVVRAKTGTLSGVHGLAGVVLDRDGAALVYAAVADRVRLENTLDARATLDDLSAALASCCPR